MYFAGKIRNLSLGRTWANRVHEKSQISGGKYFRPPAFIISLFSVLATTTETRIAYVTAMGSRRSVVPKRITTYLMNGSNRKRHSRVTASLVAVSRRLRERSDNTRSRIKRRARTTHVGDDRVRADDLRRLVVRENTSRSFVSGFLFASYINSIRTSIRSQPCTRHLRRFRVRTWTSGMTLPGIDRRLLCLQSATMYPFPSFENTQFASGLSSMASDTTAIAPTSTSAETHTYTINTANTRRVFVCGRRTDRRRKLSGTERHHHHTRLSFLAPRTRISRPNRKRLNRIFEKTTYSTLVVTLRFTERWFIHKRTKKNAHNTDARAYTTIVTRRV